MQPYSKLFLAAAAALISVGLWAQSEGNPDETHSSHNVDLLGKFSYSPSAPVAEPNSVLQICVAVSRDGSYRILRLTGEGTTQRIHGKIPMEQFHKLKTLLSHSDFRDLSGGHGGLIRQGAEIFATEIPRVDGVQRLQWLNPDGENPFPHTVAKIVNWLEGFDPKGGESFTETELPDVCPSSGGFRLLQPSVAAANIGH
jgi:hypothetical protein